MVNVVSLQTIARIYVQWSASTNRNRGNHSKITERGTKREISEICLQQEKEENREGTSALSRNADFR